MLLIVTRHGDTFLQRYRSLDKTSKTYISGLVDYIQTRRINSEMFILVIGLHNCVKRAQGVVVLYPCTNLRIRSIFNENMSTKRHYINRKEQIFRLMWVLKI